MTQQHSKLSSSEFDRHLRNAVMTWQAAGHLTVQQSSSSRAAAPAPVWSILPSPQHALAVVDGLHR